MTQTQVTLKDVYRYVMLESFIGDVRVLQFLSL